MLGLLRDFNALFDVIPLVDMEADAEIEALVRQRSAYQRQHQFVKADEVRRVLEAKGIRISDSKDGVTWRRVRR